MNQKGSVNSILLALVIILAGVLGYATLIKKPVSQNNEQPQNISKQPPVLTESAALALVKSTWGDCTPDYCSRVVAFVTQQESETYVVTATYEGLRDDSVGAERKVAVATYHSEKWILGIPVVTHQCWPGRGHQDFSSELCL